MTQLICCPSLARIFDAPVAFGTSGGNCEAVQGQPGMWQKEPGSDCSALTWAQSGLWVTVKSIGRSSLSSDDLKIFFQWLYYTYLLGAGRHASQQTCRGQRRACRSGKSRFSPCTVWVLRITSTQAWLKMPLPAESPQSPDLWTCWVDCEHELS